MDSFEHYFSRQLDAYLGMYPLNIPLDNYDFTIADNDVIGVPVRPVVVPLWPSAEKKSKYVEGSVEFTRSFKTGGLGAYAVRPVFKLDVNLHLDDFELLQDKVAVLLDCVVSASSADDSVVQACVASVKSDEFLWALTRRVPGTGSYLFHVKINNLKNPYLDEPVFVRFALDFPGLVPVSVIPE